MATDYDAPRRNETDDLAEDSLDELKARRNEAQSSVVDVDETDTAESFESSVATLLEDVGSLVNSAAARPSVAGRLFPAAGLEQEPAPALGAPVLTTFRANAAPVCGWDGSPGAGVGRIVPRLVSLQDPTGGLVGKVPLLAPAGCRSASCVMRRE